MKHMITTRCAECNHQEFLLEFDASIPQADVDALASFLEQSVEAGTRYKDGETVDFGSMILRLAVSGDVLRVEEPDLQKVPILWTVGITQSMKLLRLQKDVAESVGLGDELDFPSIRSSILVGTDLTEGLGGLVLERSESHSSDSGWFVGSLNSELDYNNAQTLQRISVYEGILKWPCIAGFLALPAGTRVETTERLTISRNGQLLKIQKGSFLDAVVWRNE